MTLRYHLRVILKVYRKAALENSHYLITANNLSFFLQLSKFSYICFYCHDSWSVSCIKADIFTFLKKFGWCNVHS